MAVAVAFALSATSVLATGDSITAEDIAAGQYEALGLDELALPPDAIDSMEGMVLENVTLNDGLSLIFSRNAGAIGGAFRQSIGSVITVAVIIMLCGAVDSLYDAGSRSIANYIPLAGTLSITLVACGDLQSLIGMGINMLDTLDAYSKGLLISLAAASGVMGAPVSASAKYVAAMFFSDLMITLINSLLVPVLYAYIAAICANAAIGEQVLARLAKFLKWVCVSALGLILTAFTAYLAISGIISGGTDSIAMKTTKMVISNAIPVVGGILSDASETVIASARIVRNSAGLIGLLAVAAVCVTPFLRLGMQYLLFKVAGAACSPISSSRLSKLTDDLAGAFGILLGMVGAGALLMLVSIVSLMNITGGV